ncbi:hypothetical protein HH214_08175 [Mucilaginibacter robiniae]|uniref:Uncharacterized protein n=1 Tax=Mucilaginibacter robiniae TaxID=2728022 RepID=A0A7L5DYJ5_9SPHI|nr:hypothetical protein [Mucilaginibacter robiniae]QJD95851.1 hypothetical protein HH214_08175 [Mucilaginibacter robiniae]
MENTLKKFCRIKLDTIKLHLDKELKKEITASKLDKSHKCDEVIEKVITEQYTGILQYMLKDYAHSKVTIDQKADMMSEFTRSALTLADDFKKQYLK